MFLEATIKGPKTTIQSEDKMFFEHDTATMSFTRSFRGHDVVSLLLPNGDDKLLCSLVETESQFYELAHIIAVTHGLLTKHLPREGYPERIVGVVFVEGPEMLPKIHREHLPELS